MFFTLKEADRFINTTREILSSISFLNFIEDKLNDDRIVGEWENIFVSY